MKAELIEEIIKLKKEKNAIILAHHYQDDDVKKVSDFIGDSLELAKIAEKCEENIIVLAGVYFMAETAKIISPGKTVLLPEEKAGCPMADMVTQEEIRSFKAEHPNAKVVCYVNSTAEVKAESDICCTSSNAVDIVRNIDGQEIIFIPDQNLGSFVADKLPEKKIILWPGYCHVHHNVTVEDVERIRNEYPEAKILVHPECKREVVALADFVGSTSQIIKKAGEMDVKTLVIGTEVGVLNALKADNPDKEFVLLSEKMLCHNMKKITLEKIRDSLLYGEKNIVVEEEISRKAREAIEKMLRN